MNVEKYKDVFDRDGFVVIENPLNDTGFQELLDNIQRYKATVAANFPEGHEGAMYGEPGNRETMIEMTKMHEHDDFFRNYAQRSTWTALAEEFLGEPVTTANIVYFNKPPRTKHAGHLTPPHQDNFYYHLDPPQLMSFWMPLERIDTENGCLRYVSGSHRKGMRTSAVSSVYGFSLGIADYSPDDWAREVCVKVNPGDAIAHHGMTIHRADSNESDTRDRTALSLIFIGQSAKVDEAWRSRHHEQIRQQQKILNRKPTV